MCGHDKTLTSLVPASAFIRGQKINSHKIQQCLVKILAMFRTLYTRALQFWGGNMPQRDSQKNHDPLHDTHALTGNDVQRGGHTCTSVTHISESYRTDTDRHVKPQFSSQFNTETRLFL